MSFLGALLLIFIVLKLVGVIAWSWWLVLTPLWVSLVFGVLQAIFVGMFARESARQIRRVRRDFRR